jgi:hypothetical protein
MKNQTPQFPEWLRLLVFSVAGVVIAIGLFSLYTAATRWTSLPDNPVVVLYFLIMLVVLPLLAVWAFILTWQVRSPRLAVVLAAIPAVLMLLRALLVGGS